MGCATWITMRASNWAVLLDCMALQKGKSSHITQRPRDDLRLCAKVPTGSASLSGPDIRGECSRQRMGLKSDRAESDRQGQISKLKQS